VEEQYLVQITISTRSATYILFLLMFVQHQSLCHLLSLDIKRHTSSCLSLDFEEPIDVPQHLLYQTVIAMTELKIHCQVSDGTISSSIEHQPLR
jgi:hypothetical protein